MNTFVLVKTLPTLAEKFGNPTSTGLGIHMAVQAMMYGHYVLFFRVKEEGVNIEEYLLGLFLLQNEKHASHISALSLPGVGDKQIIKEAFKISSNYKNLLIMNEQDLYDFMT